MYWVNVLKELIDGEVVSEIAAVGLGLGISTLFHIFRKSRDHAADRVEKTPLLTLDNELLKKVQEHHGTDFLYVSVSGKCVPDDKPLKSRYFPDRKGVILNFVTEEHKEVWAKYSHVWYDSDRELSNITESVPFSLTNGKETSVHVINPLQSSWLDETFDTINKEFRPANSSVMNSVLGLVSGNRVKGYTDTEKMLQVGTQLLGVGELFVEDSILQLRKPLEGEYIITKATRGEVISQMRSKAKLWKILALISFGITAFGIYFVSKRLWKKYQDAKKNMRRDEEIKEVKRRRNHRISGNASTQNQDDNMCVVCLSRPRECVILNCGHICACVDCIEMLPSPKLCPMCRSPLVNIIPLFHA